MEITIKLKLDHVDDTGRDDPERVADIAYWQLLDGREVDAGNKTGDARYKVTDYELVSGEPEHDDEGNDLDVLPEAPI